MSFSNLAYPQLTFSKPSGRWKLETREHTIKLVLTFSDETQDFYHKNHPDDLALPGELSLWVFNHMANKIGPTFQVHYIHTRPPHTTDLEPLRPTADQIYQFMLLMHGLKPPVPLTFKPDWGSSIFRAGTPKG